MEFSPGVRTAACVGLAVSSRGFLVELRSEDGGFLGGRVEWRWMTERRTSC